MFWSDEWITGKKGSLSIVWLMATLGPRSKRVTRKAITTLEISRTCNLIATPPEPMALRLSGQLLVGVARVFDQSCDIFYNDVQNFDTLLRRSLVTDTHGNKTLPGVLDLPGGGTSRADHITFPNIDVPDTLVGIDLEFDHVDWNKPLGSKRPRRFTSKLSSPSSQMSGSQTVNRDEEEDSDDGLEDADLDDDSEVHRSAKRPRSQSRLQSVEPLDRDQTPAPDEPHQLEPIILDILDDPINDIPSSDHNEPWNSDVPDFPETLGEPEPAAISVVELGATEDAAPPKKKRRVKRKVVVFDNLIEVETLDISPRDYAENMRKLKKEKDLKKIELAAQATATMLVDGSGLWINFTDEDMAAMFSTITKVPKFKWELDVRANRDGKPLDKPLDNPNDNPFPNMGEPFTHVEEPFNQNDDPFVGFPFAAPDNVSPNRHFYPQTPDAPEVGRQNALPWSEAMQSYHNWPMQADAASDFTTPSTNRVSIMTLRELRIRKSGTDPLHSARRIIRSGSIASITSEHIKGAQLVDDDLELPDYSGALAGAFSPAMLALLESQCRDFFSFVDTRMIEEGTDEIAFDEVLPTGANKHIAAAAFHNVLTLATKRIFNVSQGQHFGPITLRISATK